MPTRIDPARLNDKDFTRRSIGKDDYRVTIDGLTAGRIMQTMFASDLPKWSWSITGPYLPPELNPGNGHADTLVQAQEHFKAKFWQWHRWAAQRGGGDWYGADAPALMCNLYSLSKG